MAVTERLVLLLLCITVAYVESNRTFTIDHSNNCFLKDGEPFRYVSGSLHYFRVPNQYWRDRMEKMKAAGLNALQTYVEWSGHEPEPGTYNFEGDYDLVKFLQTAQDVGLLVVFRPGPYICAERDMGGFPYWLLRNSPDIQLRTMDPTYIQPVERWMTYLLTKIEPMLYKNGGPVILVQIENEYGQHDRCDKVYMKYLRDLNWNILGKDVILFRTDLPSERFYKCDLVDGVMVTADFGSGTNITAAAGSMRKFNLNGPLVVTEYYPGWMDHWGQAHASVDADAICKTLEELLAANWSVNFYMFHGGTNFGFTNGANAPYMPQPTSYDYAAPISEAGDPTPLFTRIRNIVGKYLPLPPGPAPQPSPKLALPEPLNFVYTGSVLSLVEQQGNKVYSQYPKTFEELSVQSGFVVYSTLLPFIPKDPANLTVKSIGDRVYVLVDGFFVGVLSRQINIFSMPILVQKNQVLTLIVENQGRINYGEENKDFKGLLSNVTVDDTILENWVMTPVNLSLDSLLMSMVESSQSGSAVPGFFVVNFTLPRGTPVADTFLDTTGWTKGVAILNGFNLGRYWPVLGPQVTLYVPGVLLKPYPGINTLVVMEMEIAPCMVGLNRGPLCTKASCSMRLVDKPIIDGPVPGS